MSIKIQVDGLDVLNASGYNVSDDAQLSYMREHGEPIDDWVFEKCETWQELYLWLDTLSIRQRSHSINVMLEDNELTYVGGVGKAPENVMIEENEIVLLLAR
tara:strand:+ start:138 stop:443 length:306 start_codon:yes stop_codon:yes gene_type:complete